MATFTFSKTGGRYPNATVVKAYPESNWPNSQVNTSALPVGSETNSQTMTSDTLTFTGLTAGTRYVAHATVGSQQVYTSFTPGEDISESAAVVNQGDLGVVTDAMLASPANSVYRDVLGKTLFSLTDAIVAETYFMFGGNGAIASANGAPNAMFYLDPADFAVAGLTTRLRVRGMWTTNTQAAPNITVTFGLYPISAVAGAADSHTMTAGTVVAGSTVAIATPSVSTRNIAHSADFTHPAAGYYALGAATSGTPAADSRGALTMQLHWRNT